MRNPTSLLLILALVAACGDGDRLAVTPFPFEVTVAGDTLHLSHAPNQVAFGYAETRLLAPETEFATTAIDEISGVRDMRLHGESGFLVADLVSRRILLLDTPDAHPREVARAGDGPGEVSISMVSVVPAGDHVVTWEVAPDRTFQTLRLDGTPRVRTAPPVDGDWRAFVTRQPATSWNHLANGPEFISDRLTRAGDAHYLHIVQDNEWQRPHPPMGEPIPNIWSTAILYDLDATVVDTIARHPAPRTRFEVIEGVPEYYATQDILAPSLRVSGSNDYFAATHGDSSSVIVTSRRSEHADLVVSWPSWPRPVGDVELDAFVDRELAHAFLHDPEFREEWEARPRAEQNRSLASVRDRYNRLPDLAPQVTRILVDDECLFLFGFNIDDAYDGTARRFIGVHLPSGTAEVLEVRLPLLRAHDAFAGRLLFSTKRDDGGWGMHIFRHGMRCSR